MTYDEMVVNIITQAVLPVTSDVMHLEAYQINEQYLRKHFVIYGLEHNEQNGGPEISGVPGHKVAVYRVTCVSKDSDKIRQMADVLMDQGRELANETYYGLHSAEGFDWLDVNVDQEAVEYAIELEAKGYKTTTLQLVLYYKELSNNGSS